MNNDFRQSAAAKRGFSWEVSHCAVRCAVRCCVLPGQPMDNRAGPSDLWADPGPNRTARLRFDFELGCCSAWGRFFYVLVSHPSLGGGLTRCHTTPGPAREVPGGGGSPGETLGTGTWERGRGMLSSTPSLNGKSSGLRCWAFLCSPTRPRST